MKLLAIMIFAALSPKPAQAWQDIVKIANTQEPCFSDADGCYPPVKNFAPITLRGQFDYRDQLIIQILKKYYRDEWATIQEYPEFTIQNYGKDPAKGFAVEVTFTLGPGGAPQTIYVYGEESLPSKGEVEVTVMSYQDKYDQQETIRSKLKNLDNIVHQGRDFQSVMAQVRLDDLRRAQAVGAVITAWESAMGTPDKNKATAITSADMH